MTYTYRNGEEEPPTHAGSYWFFGVIDGGEGMLYRTSAFIPEAVAMIENKNQSQGDYNSVAVQGIAETFPLEWCKGRWWGHIPYPDEFAAPEEYADQGGLI